MPVVLDEDTYTEAISFIIERDFFPMLAKSRARQAYLRAQHTGTRADSRHASNAPLDPSQPRSATNLTSDRPLNFYDDNAERLESRVNLDLSLDQFQSLYTSEDNASFTELLEKANVKRKEKFKWIFDRDTSQLRIGDAEPVKLIASSSTAGKNTLMYFPSGQSRSLLEEAEASSRAAPKEIAYTNTQLEQSIAVDPSTIAPTDIAAKQGKFTPWKELSSGASASSPSFRGYNLVDATPSHSPSRIGTPMMTWGEVEGTPMLIRGSETPGPQFSLPKVSRREELGMRLSEKASRAYRKKTDRRLVSGGTPRTGEGLMSPAARHLMQRSHTPLRDFDAALRSSYSRPSSSSRRPTTRPPDATPTPLFRAGATPTFASPFRSPFVQKRA